MHLGIDISLGIYFILTETIQTMAFDVPQNLQEMVQGAPLRHTANCDSVSPESLP